MHLNLGQATDLASAMVKKFHEAGVTDTRVILGVPFPFLQAVGGRIAAERDIYLAAQNMHHKDSGAYTGEVSAEMLASVGCEYVILGHSERRAYFDETNDLLAIKNKKALEAGLKPIYCIGETLEERESGMMLQVISGQMKQGIFGLSQEEFGQCVIAYEPVWAIGTGKTATPEQAQEVHKFIRELIRERYDDATAANTSILYGGSVKPGNAAGLFSQPDIDGGLVGGASLKADDFSEIMVALSQS